MPTRGPRSGGPEDPTSKPSGFVDLTQLDDLIHRMSEIEKSRVNRESSTFVNPNIQQQGFIPRRPTPPSSFFGQSVASGPPNDLHLYSGRPERLADTAEKAAIASRAAAYRRANRYSEKALKQAQELSGELEGTQFENVGKQAVVAASTAYKASEAARRESRASKAAWKTYRTSKNPDDLAFAKSMTVKADKARDVHEMTSNFSAKFFRDIAEKGVTATNKNLINGKNQWYEELLKKIGNIQSGAGGGGRKNKNISGGLGDNDEDERNLRLGRLRRRLRKKRRARSAREENEAQRAAKRSLGQQKRNSLAENRAKQVAARSLQSQKKRSIADELSKRSASQKLNNQRNRALDKQRRESVRSLQSQKRSEISNTKAKQMAASRLNNQRNRALDKQRRESARSLAGQKKRSIAEETAKRVASQRLNSQRNRALDKQRKDAARSLQSQKRKAFSDEKAKRTAARSLQSQKEKALYQAKQKGRQVGQARRKRRKLATARESKRVQAERMERIKTLAKIGFVSRAAHQAASGNIMGAATTAAWASGNPYAIAATELASVTMTAAKALSQLSERAFDSNKKLSAYSGSVAYAYGDYIQNEYRRKFQFAAGTERTATDLVESMDRMRDAWMKYNIGASNISNTISYEFSRFSSGFGKKAGDDMSSVAKMISSIPGMKIGGSTVGDLTERLGAAAYDAGIDTMLGGGPMGMTLHWLWNKFKPAPEPDPAAKDTPVLEFLKGMRDMRDPTPSLPPALMGMRFPVWKGPH